LGRQRSFRGNRSLKGAVSVRILRRAANALLRTALPDLETAESETLGAAFAWARWLAAGVGAPLPKPIDESIIRNIADIVGRAIIDTDYGLPLRFECPLIVTLAASEHCPFACANCYSRSGGVRGSAPAAFNAATFEKVARSKAPFVLITGGEPLATAGIRDGLEVLLDAGKLVRVSTNASVEKFLATAERYRSTLAFVLPIWGTRRRHNELRGARSFERVEENLKALNARGLAGHLLIVVADDDLSLFEEIHRLRQEYRISTIRVSRKVRVGRLDDGDASLPTDLARRLADQVRRLQRRGASVLLDLPELRGSRGERLIQKLLGIPDNQSCSAGSWMMHLDHEGTAYPCFTFEGGRQFAAEAGLSMSDQWSRVKQIRTGLGRGEACIGETHAGTKP
jgi:MoaA/NifB/PqqE/SkfB family radical SAM enzyme